MSKDELGRTISVRPPTVNKKIKPKSHSMADDHSTLPLGSVANQLNISTPIGIAIIIVHV